MKFSVGLGKDDCPWINMKEFSCFMSPKARLGQVQTQIRPLNPSISSVSTWCGTINSVLLKSIYHCVAVVRLEDTSQFLVLEQYSDSGDDGRWQSVNGQTPAVFHVAVMDEKDIDVASAVNGATILKGPGYNDAFIDDPWKPPESTFSSEANNMYCETCAEKKILSDLNGLFDWIERYSTENDYYSMSRQCQNFATGLYNGLTHSDTSRYQEVLAGVGWFFGAMSSSSSSRDLEVQHQAPRRPTLLTKDLPRLATDIDELTSDL